MIKTQKINLMENKRLLNLSEEKIKKIIIKFFLLTRFEYDIKPKNLSKNHGCKTPSFKTQIFGGSVETYHDTSLLRLLKEQLRNEDFIIYLKCRIEDSH